jgi:hypothetical protein
MQKKVIKNYKLWMEEVIREKKMEAKNEKRMKRKEK